MFNPLSLASDRRVTIAGREISALSREKTIVLALIIQLFIAAFSSFLVVGLTSLYDPGSAQGEIEVAVSGDQQGKLLDAADESASVSATVYDSRAGALAAFENREVNAVVTARSERTDQGSRIAIDAAVPAESFETTLIVVTLRELLSELERTERGERADFLECRLQVVDGFSGDVANAAEVRHPGSPQRRNSTRDTAQNRVNECQFRDNSDDRRCGECSADRQVLRATI